VRVALVHGQRVTGGAHRRITEQARRLAARPDVELTEVVVAGTVTVTGEPVVVPLTLTADAAPAWKRPVCRYADLVRTVLAYRRLQAHLTVLDPDVVWLNPCTLVQAPWVGADRAGRSVYYCDEPPRLHYDPSARATTRRRTRALYWPLRRALRGLDARTARRSVTVLANSRFSAARIAAAYGRPATVVACGVAAAFADCGPGPDRPTHVLSVGSLIPAKGHDVAIAAVATSGLGLPLVVVAHRNAAGERDRLEHLAAAAGLVLDVRIGVNDADLAALYAAALATLYLARAEPFGLASIESQACGTPVIVADDGGLPETVTDPTVGLVSPRRPDAVAAVLQALAADPADRRERAARARRAASGWTWERSTVELAAELAAVARRA
jgi:glycosyltransferase involved in cell wall biosynthesis